MIDEKAAKEIMLRSAKTQIEEIRKAAIDMRKALKTDDDEQIKFVITTVSLIHNFLFIEAPKLAAKEVLQKKYNH